MVADPAKATTLPATDGSPQPTEAPYPPLRHAWYMVGILMVVYVFSFMDRQILSLLVQPIRRDLGISDFQMSLLMGFSFAVFYTAFGIPLGRMADSKSRRGLIAVGLAVWSLMTAGCGLAKQYWQLLLLRMGVGVGEAALSPASYSLIADSFPRHRLATAISVYSMGIYIGSGAASLIGGLVVGAVSGQEAWDLPIVGELHPWQVVFFAVGLPGLLLVPLLRTIKEPVRRGIKMIQRPDGRVVPDQVPIRQVLEYVRANWKTFLCHNLGFALLSFSSYGSGAWVPTFLIRNHGLEAREAGIWYGSGIMVMGTLGIVFGGRLADWLASRGHEDARMRAGLIAAIVWFPMGVLFPLVPSSNLALLLLMPAIFTASMPFGCAAAAIQEMMPNPMRGQASALYLFIVNLIGLGLGPSAVAATTDLVFGDDMAIRYSLLSVGVAAHLLSALLLWGGLQPFRDSLARLRVWTKAQTEG